MLRWKLFIIPWLYLPSTVYSQSVAAPNPQFADLPFYQFLQRQNQINNAILLNNAMLANSLGAVSKEHHLRLPNTVAFPAGSLHASMSPSPPLFQSFPQTIPAVPVTEVTRFDFGLDIGSVPEFRRLARLPHGTMTSRG